MLPWLHLLRSRCGTPMRSGARGTTLLLVVGRCHELPAARLLSIPSADTSGGLSCRSCLAQLYDASPKLTSQHLNAGCGINCILSLLNIVTLGMFRLLRFGTQQCASPATQIAFRTFSSIRRGSGEAETLGAIEFVTKHYVAAPQRVSEALVARYIYIYYVYIDIPVI